MKVMTRGTGLFGVVVVAAVVAWAVSPSYGVVVEDNPLNHLVSPTSIFAMCGSYGGASAVLISPTQALTAGHVAAGCPAGTLTLNTPNGMKSFKATKTIIDPSADLAIIDLATNTGLSGIPLYTGSSEAGQVNTILGWGLTGVNAPNGINGVDHQAQIKVSFDTGGTGGLLYDMFLSSTASGSLGASKEGCIAMYDSGGPSLICIGGKYYIDGIHEGLVNMVGGSVYPVPGDYMVDTRVSTNLKWIDSLLQTGAVSGSGVIATPEPASMTLLAIGGLGVLLRRRRSA